MLLPDERPRPDATMESLGKLRPAFEKEGTVTAGNAPGLNDGASAVVVMSGDAVKRTGAKPLARVNGYARAERPRRWSSTPR